MHIAGGLRLTHRLHFPAGDGTQTLRVTQEFVALPGDEARQPGFTRRVVLDGAPSDSQWELLVLPGDVTVDADGRSAELAGPRGQVHVTLANDSTMKLSKTARGAVVMLASLSGRASHCELHYRSEAAPDQFAPLPQIDRTLARIELDVVPGFEAVRLPVTDQVMPTGLAWRPTAR